MKLRSFVTKAHYASFSPSSLFFSFSISISTPLFLFPLSFSPFSLFNFLLFFSSLSFPCLLSPSSVFFSLSFSLSSLIVSSFLLLCFSPSFLYLFLSSLSFLHTWALKVIANNTIYLKQATLKLTMSSSRMTESRMTLSTNALNRLTFCWMTDTEQQLTNILASAVILVSVVCLLSLVRVSLMYHSADCRCCVLTGLTFGWMPIYIMLLRSTIPIVYLWELFVSRIERAAPGAPQGADALARGEEPPEQRAGAHQETAGRLDPSQGKSWTKIGRSR